MSATTFTFLAPSGSTGNNTFSSVGIPPMVGRMAVAYVAEVAGTTATWKVQGTLAGSGITDANAAWFDLPYVLPSTDTLSQAAIVRTTLGSDVIWLAGAANRFFQRVRLVVSANTGQTYRAELYCNYAL